MFQPGPMASNTICGVRAIVLAVEGATNASRVMLTDTFLSLQDTVTVPAEASFRLAPARTLTVVWWSLSILPVSITAQEASVVT